MIQALSPWAPAAVWAGVLFLLSSAPSLGPPWLPPWGDEAAHAVLYSVLGMTLAWGRRRAGAPRGRTGAAFLVGLGILYGASDEWHQSFVPGRDPALGDLLADTLGVALGYSLFTLFRDANPDVGPESGSDA